MPRRRHRRKPTQPRRKSGACPRQCSHCAGGLLMDDSCPIFTLSLPVSPIPGAFRLRSPGIGSMGTRPVTSCSVASAMEMPPVVQGIPCGSADVPMRWRGRSRESPGRTCLRIRCRFHTGRAEAIPHAWVSPRDLCGGPRVKHCWLMWGVPRENKDGRGRAIGSGRRTLVSHSQGLQACPPSDAGRVPIDSLR